MYDKIIFLDIDGVLNTYKELGKYGNNYIDPVKVSRLEKIISATGAKVVVSSNWRYNMDLVFEHIPSIKPYIIDRTGNGKYGRVSEIEDWLEANPTKNWVAIDDLYLHLPDHFINTDENVGLTDSDISKAIDILSKEEMITNSFFNKINKLALYFEKLSKAKPIYLYHGTNKSNLEAILSQGLLSNPKNRAWGDDPDASFFMPSRQSLEGVYLTSNLLTASGSANNRQKTYTNPIIIMVQVQPNSLILDEDEIGIRFAPSHNEFITALYYFDSIFNKTDNELGDKIHNFINTKLYEIKSKINNFDLNKNLENRLIDILKEIPKASLTRSVSYIDDYNYKRAWESYEHKKGYMPVKPNSSNAEMEYKKYQDLITRALKIVARHGDPSGDWSFNNTRVLENIGFSGGNKIIAILEYVKDGEFDYPPMKLIYPNSINEIPEEALSKLRNDISRRIGEREIKNVA